MMQVSDYGHGDKISSCYMYYSLVLQLLLPKTILTKNSYLVLWLFHESSIVYL